MNGRPRLKDNPFLYMLIVSYCTNFVYVSTFLLIALSLLTGYFLVTPTVLVCCIGCAIIENYTNRLINKYDELLKDYMFEYFSDIGD